jgi:putative ABC transport system permease protein
VAASISQTVAEPRFRTWLLSLFAAAGLALTLIGIYGVISYSVSQRTREIGVRVALGAPRERVLGLILGQGLRLALLGAALGLAGSLALTRVIASELFGVKPADPATLIGAVLSMVGIALLAAYLPARRATRVDPVIALRHE